MHEATKNGETTNPNPSGLDGNTKQEQTPMRTAKRENAGNHPRHAGAAPPTDEPTTQRSREGRTAPDTEPPVHPSPLA